MLAKGRVVTVAERGFIPAVSAAVSAAVAVAAPAAPNTSPRWWMWMVWPHAGVCSDDVWGTV